MPVGILLAALASLAASNADPSAKFAEAIGSALQADEAKALAALNGVDLSALPERDRAAAACMAERFGPGSRPEVAASESVTDRALAIYRAYWHGAMTRPERREIEEQKLATNLRRLLLAADDVGLDALEGTLSTALKKEGFFSLQGRTGLLRELMVWSKQERRIMGANLPEGRHDVTVNLLDGFKNLGWGAYATCSRASTGGWATESALFAVVPKYQSLDTEEFQVTFLGHEGQHFADKNRFKGLKSWELEYRAKLTELAQANVTRTRVLGKFVTDQGDDPASPHSYANRQLLSAMVKRLDVASADEISSADVTRVQAAAVELLREDSARRAAAGE